MSSLERKACLLILISCLSVIHLIFAVCFLVKLFSFPYLCFSRVKRVGNSLKR